MSLITQQDSPVLFTKQLTGSLGRLGSDLVHTLTISSQRVPFRWLNQVTRSAVVSRSEKKPLPLLGGNSVTLEESSREVENDISVYFVIDHSHIGSLFF